MVIIVSDHARGADPLGERFAKEFGLSCECHPANWKAFDKGAGLIRNAEMAKSADALIAFWDGRIRGTTHMVNFARYKGLDVSIVDYTLTRQVSDTPTLAPVHPEPDSHLSEDTLHRRNNISFRR